MDWGHSLLEEFLHSPTHTPPLPPPHHLYLSSSASSLICLCSLERLKHFKQRRGCEPSVTLIRAAIFFFFFFFFSCHLIDLITWSILLNNVSHLVPLFWDLSISCLLRDLRGEALFALMSADGPLRTYTTVSEVWIMEQDYKGLRIESTWSDYQTFTIRCMFDHGVSGGPYNFGSLYTPNGLSGTI